MGILFCWAGGLSGRCALIFCVGCEESRLLVLGHASDRQNAHSREVVAPYIHMLHNLVMNQLYHFNPLELTNSLRDNPLQIHTTVILS